MKKIITTLTLLILLAVPTISLAVGEYTEIPATSLDSPGALLDKINTIGNWVFSGLLLLAAVFMVIAGYFFVTGGGEPEKVNKARQMLINALIGVAVGLASKGLVTVIMNIVSE
ncbi:MAG: hypothetical protein ABIG29_00315 [Candidatus Nealsonbacteria bacterium]